MSASLAYNAHRDQPMKPQILPPAIPNNKSAYRLSSKSRIKDIIVSNFVKKHIRTIAGSQTNVSVELEYKVTQ